jgi:RHS repeat-associated protein
VLSPKVLGVGHTVLNAGTGQMQFSVEYDFPNNYCQTWDPASTWPIPPPSHQTRLQIFSGANELVASVGVFEHGIWKPTLTVGCGAQDLTVVATTFGASPSQASMNYSLAAGCRQPDRGSCPAGSGGAGTGVGQPINVGSGDVSTSITLFTLQQSPLPLVFNLSYHSSALTYTNVTVPEPLGKGWTHPYNQALKPIPSTNRLYHYTADGREFEYVQNGGVWNASRPAEARGTVTLNSTTHIYELTDLDGTKTDFYDSSGSAPGPAGAWVSTTDRWGNTITGAYASGNLITITQSIGTNPTGRTITLSYPAGPLQSISVPETPSPLVWNFTVTSGLLMGIRDPDPLHMSVNWRSFGYSASQLAAITDDASKTLEGHTYETPGGRGVESYSEGGTRNYVKVEYDQPLPGQRRVTTRIDASTSQVSVFTVNYQGGRWLPAQIVGPCSTCSGAGGDTQSFTYYADNHVDTATDGKGNVTKFVYNADGNVTSRVEAQNDASVSRTTTWQYTYPGWPNFWTTMTQPSAGNPGQSKTTTRALSGSGETTLTVTEAGYLLSTDSGTTSFMTTTSFDSRHRVSQVNGPRAIADTTTYTYFPDSPVSNNAGRLHTVTDAVTLTTTYADYDIFGTPLTTTDPNGVQTVLTTDTRGRILTSTLKGHASEPTDFVTSYTYDGRDRLLQTTLPLQNAIAYVYEDGSNRLLDTIRLDSSNPRTQRERLHLTLNDYGGKIQEEAQKCGTPAAACTTWNQQRTESFAYDTKNRLLKTVHPVPASSFIQYTYDADGLLSQVQDERHASANTFYDYDALNRLSKVRQTLANAPASPNPNCVVEAGKTAACYGYDAHDNLTSVIDPNGNLTTYLYDDFKRLQKQISPVSGTTTYSYDEAGNLLTSTDANGAMATRAYDVANRLTSASSARSGQTTELVAFTYDDVTAGKHGKGRVATMTDPTGSTSFAYDRRGLVKAESRMINGTAFAQSYGYDANGNRTSLTYPSTRVVSYTYDYADRSYSATGGSTNYVNAATYFAFGPENTLSLGNSTTRTATFDLRYRPATLTLTGAGSSVSYSYSPDALGNITAITDINDAAYTRNFGYDDLNRLTSATTGTGGTPPLWGETGTFTYDSLGNRKSMNLGTRAITYSYDAVSGHDTSRLKAVSEGSLTVQHDPAGNETVLGATLSSYSPRNLLASTSGAAAPLKLSYDGRGVRVAEAAWAQTELPFRYLTPCRLIDTRAGSGFPAGYGPPSILGSGTQRTFVMTGQCGIPANASAVSLNVAVWGPTTRGGLRMFPAGGATPLVSTLNWEANILALANAAIVPLGAGGAMTVQVDGTGTVDIFVDVNGYFPTPGAPGDLSFRTVAPCRVIDTRTGSGFSGGYGPPSIAGSGTQRTFILAGQCGIPANAGAISLNVAVWGPTTRGGLRMFPAGGATPVVSTLNWEANILALANAALVPLGAGGAITVQVDGPGTVDVFIDVNGYFATPAVVTRNFFYTPELNLLSETNVANPGATPAPLYEYIWFGGRPVAQETVGAPTATRWIVTDHLGTPFLQTDSSRTVTWRAEYEPFGNVYAQRVPGSTDYQPLRFAGQEERSSSPGRSYNIFRWYRPDVGQYTQADPIGSAVFANAFAYAAGNPLSWADRFGLYNSGDVIYRCPPPGKSGSCDVVTILYDPSPNEDNNGDEMAIAYGDSKGCAAPCSGTAHLTHLNGPTDPYAGYQVRGVCSQLASYEEIARRWGEWRQRNPPWTPMGSPALSQCFTLANHLTGIGKSDAFGFQWGWPPIVSPVEHDLTYWKTRCRAK